MKKATAIENKRAEISKEDVGFWFADYKVFMVTKSFVNKPWPVLRRVSIIKAYLGASWANLIEDNYRNQFFLEAGYFTTSYPFHS